MKTWFDYDTQKWVSEQPKKYWTGLVCHNTKEKIFIGDTVSIEIHKQRKIAILEEHQRNPYLWLHWSSTKLFQEILKPILIKH